MQLANTISHKAEVWHVVYLHATPVQMIKHEAN